MRVQVPSAFAKDARTKKTWIPAYAGMTDRQESTFEIFWVFLGGVMASTRFLIRKSRRRFFTAFFSPRCCKFLGAVVT